MKYSIYSAEIDSALWGRLSTLFFMRPKPNKPWHCHPLMLLLNGKTFRYCTCHLKCGTLLPSFNPSWGFDLNAWPLLLELYGVVFKPFPLVHYYSQGAVPCLARGKFLKKNVSHEKGLKEEWLPWSHEKWQLGPKGEIPNTEMEQRYF